MPVARKMSVCWVLSVLVAAVCATVASADWQSPAKQGQTEYNLFVPDGYSSARKYPLVLVLHSAGFRGKDAATIKGIGPCAMLTSAKVQQANPSFVVVPMCPNNDKWVNVPKWNQCSYSISEITISDRMKEVLEAVAAIRAKYSIDPARLYVVGGSMGGYGSWDVICRDPETWAAAIPIAGGGDPSKAADLVKAKVAIWALHGLKDYTVPVKGTKDMIEALTKAGGKPKVTYSDVGHLYEQPWETKGQSEELAAWLFAQKRSATTTKPPKPATTQPALSGS